MGGTAQTSSTRCVTRRASLPLARRRGGKNYPRQERQPGQSERRDESRVDFRLAFVPSKFRLGAEPEPFCVELHLPKDEPWTLRDVTAGILKAADDSLSQEKQAKEERLQK